MMLEALVRSVVVDELGVDASTLTPRTLLVDDLGVDSLDLADLGCALENEFGTQLDDDVMGSLRTYGDLVGAVGCALWQHDGSRDLDPGPGIVVRARVAPARHPAKGVIRAGRLDPYLVEVIAEDALRRGTGTMVDLRLASEADEEDVGTVRAAFSWLAERGVRVRVGRDVDREAPPSAA